MKKIVIITLLFINFYGCTVNRLNDVETVEQNVGELLLLHDSKYSYQEDLNSFGSAKIYDQFIKVYNQEIKDLSEDYRVHFFWFAMWHLDFDGHYMEEFQALIIQDCGDAFISRLEGYIDKESQLKRSKSKLYLSEKVLAGLKLRKHLNEKQTLNP